MSRGVVFLRLGMVCDGSVGFLGGFRCSLCCCWAFGLGLGIGGNGGDVQSRIGGDRDRAFHEVKSVKSRGESCLGGET